MRFEVVPATTIVPEGERKAPPAAEPETAASTTGGSRQRGGPQRGDPPGDQEQNESHKGATGHVVGMIKVVVGR